MAFALVSECQEAGTLCKHIWGSGYPRVFDTCLRDVLAAESLDCMTVLAELLEESKADMCKLKIYGNRGH